MKLVDLTLDDVLHICRNLREQDALEVDATSFENTPEARANRFMAVADGAWVAKIEDEAVAVGGTLCVWPGVFNIWMVGTERWSECKFSLTKFARKVVIPALKKQGAHRIQCYSLATHAVAHGWLEMLGAKREAEHKGYGKNGETFYCYAWDLT
jgi:hypothetical protein